MSDLKISQLSDGGASQAADEYVIARSGANYRIDGASVTATATSVGTLSSLTISGDLTVDTSTLKVDSSQNRVGVNTTTPNDAFQVVGTAVFGADAGYVGTGSPKVVVYGDGNTETSALWFQGGVGSALAGLKANDSAFYITNTYAGNALGTNGIKLDQSGNLAVDTDTLYVDAANNRVGIGTASPAALFHLSGATSVNSEFRHETVSAGTAARTLYYRNNTLKFLAGLGASSGNDTYEIAGPSSAFLTVDASGNLGLGVTPSAWRTTSSTALQVNARCAIWSDTAVTAEVLNNAYMNNSSVWTYVGTESASRYRQYQGKHEFYTAASGTAGNAITFTQAMTLDASGNLDFQQASTTTTTIGFKSSVGTRVQRIRYDDNDGSLTIGGGTSTAYPLLFYTGNTERARITSGGYFKASNAGTYAGSTALYHELRQTETTAPTAVVSNSSASPYGQSIAFTGASPDNNTNWFLECSDSTTTRCYIWSDGDLANHDGVYGTISDERLKQDIVDAGSAWDDLKAVRFRKYRMKSDVEANPNAPAMLGVIAQELEQVMPGLVDEHPEFKEQEVTDEDGNVTTERVQVGTTKTVKSSILLMKAAVALQEAMARIEALEARLEALEA